MPAVITASNGLKPNPQAPMKKATQIRSPTESHLKVYIIRHEDSEIVLYLDETTCQIAEQLKLDFSNYIAEKLQENAENFTRTDVLFLFLEFCLLNSECPKELMSSAFEELCSNSLCHLNPHCYLSEGTVIKFLKLKQVLNIYYQVAAKLEKTNFNYPKPAILDPKNGAKISIIFGGQGNSQDHFGELIDLVETYSPIINEFIEAYFSALKQVALEDKYTGLLEKGFDLAQWIENPSKKPNEDYISRSSISLPLVGLLHLLNYCVLSRTANISPKELLKSFSNATGHSQGIVSAFVISCSNSTDDLISNGQKALRFLFFIGLHAELAFPRCSISPKALHNSLNVIPSPMLSISNITQKELEGILQEAGEFVSDIEIGLINGPKSFVCCGPSKALYGLYSAIDRIKAGQEDQSRVPFSERKKKINARFLPISSPFHFSKLHIILKDLSSEIEDHGDFFSTGCQLGLPIVCPHSGKVFHKIEDIGDVNQYLLDSICIMQVNWSLATSSLHQPGITHFLDFGPGGTMGIGLLTHRIREGSGVQILLASSNKSDFGLQGRCLLLSEKISSISFGVNWSKEFGPKIVKRSSDGKVNCFLYIVFRFSLKPFSVSYWGNPLLW
jgi:fatty acid synthase subunit beta, fungi type